MTKLLFSLTVWRCWQPSPQPDNFLFLTKDENAPLKATDFGLSIRHWSDEPKLTSRSGTPAYMAPELVMQMYDEKVRAAQPGRSI